MWWALIPNPRTGICRRMGVETSGAWAVGTAAAVGGSPGGLPGGIGSGPFIKAFATAKMKT